MRKLIFRLGMADKQAIRRVLEGTRNGEAFEVEVAATASSISLDCIDGDLVEDVRFYDEAENGGRSVVRTVLSAYKVGPEQPLVGGTCVFERSVEVPQEDPVIVISDVDPTSAEPEGSQASEGEQPSADAEGPATDAAGEELSVAEETESDDTGVSEAAVDEQLQPEEPTEEIVEAELVEEPAVVEEQKPKTDADHIRDYLTANPNAENKEVIAALKEQGVNVSSSQVSRAKKQLLEG